MDNKKIIELQKIGLIDKTQKWYEINRNDLRVRIGEIDYDAHPCGLQGRYQLKKHASEYYLVHSLKRVELLNYQNNDVFLENSSFYLVYDDLLCSIFPCNNVNCLLSYNKLDKLICLKKHIACINSNILTIFNISFNNTNFRKKEKPPEEIKKPKPNNINLVAFNQLQILHSNNFKWLDIVIANKIGNIPSYLKSRITYSGQENIPSHEVSLIYLNFIINNYNNLANKICFLKTTPILKFNKVSEQNIIQLEDFIMGHPKDLIDMRISIKGDRIGYRDNDRWSNWYDNKIYPVSKTSQPLFLTHILKHIPNNKYLEYSSSNSRLVSKEQLLKYPLSFYENLYDKYLNHNLYCLDYLDRTWDSLLL